jgi:signal transduction histidine kinase
VEKGPLRTIAEAFARWPQVTADDVPVQFEGVVTGTMPSGAFRLHDGQLGIFVARSTMGQSLTPGDRVSVAGVLRHGGFSPWITLHQLSPLGRGEFPRARPGSFELLASGAADNQWLEIEGVVRAAEVLESRDFIVLDLALAGGNLRVLVNHGPHPDLGALIDAEVRMRGVASVNVNKHGHVVEPSFRVPSFAEVVVTRPAPAAAFALPVVPIRQLMQPVPDDLKRHRRRTRGVVTRRLSDTLFFVREGTFGLKVETRRPVTFQPGDAVDLAGFPTMAEGLAVLQQTVALRLAAGAPPEPVHPTLTALLEGSHNSDLVTVRARLVDWVVTGQKATLILQLDDQLFKGLLNAPDPHPLALPEKGSVVDVTGVCIISELEDIWFYQPRSFLLLLAGLADLKVVQAPPWWNSERLWRALALVGSVLLAAGGWVWALRRQIGRKRSVIEQQARHAAALEERTRIARDLHDTLEQGLTGLSLQMKAMETDFAGAHHPAHERLKSARRMLRQSRALARNAIQEMRSETAVPRGEGLVAGLRRVAEGWNRSGALGVELRFLGDIRPLPVRLENHLLGIGTEAMTNAVKHGRADAIEVELDYRAKDVVLRIKDNGTGFDTTHVLAQTNRCFGLIGMRERARELCGEIRIASRPGEGAEILVTVPFAPGAA